MSRSTGDYVYLLIVAIVACAVFANSLGNDFVYDDITAIKENPRLATPWSLKTFFGTSYWGNARADQHLYRPLTIWSFALDRALFGPGPFGVHLHNVAANAVVSCLVYLLMLAALRTAGYSPPKNWAWATDQKIALTGAVLFAIHPVHTEVVANGVGRAEIYSALFVFLGALLHFHSMSLSRTGEQTDFGMRGSAAMKRYGGALVCYWLGLGFKESAVTLPGLIFLFDWLLVCRGNLKGLMPRLWTYFGYALPLGIYAAMRISVVGTGTPAIQEVMAGTTRLTRFLFAGGVIVQYVGQLIVPWKLVAEYSDYTHPVREAARDLVSVVSPLFLLGIGGLACLFVQKKRYLELFGLTWFFLSLFPTSNLLITIGTVRADRLLYLPSFGFCLLLVTGVAAMAGIHRMIPIVGLAALTLFYAGRTVVRNRDWSTSERLWSVTVRDNPGAAVGWGFVGDDFVAAGKLKEAEDAYLRAQKLRESLGFFYPEVRNKRAKLMHERNASQEALVIYREVLARDPKNFVANLNVGGMLMRDPATVDESIRHLRAAIAANPNDFRPYTNIAQAYRLKKEIPVALEFITKACERGPGMVYNWQIKSELHAMLGQTAEAKQAAEKARAIGTAHGGSANPPR